MLAATESDRTNRERAASVIKLVAFFDGHYLRDNRAGRRQRTGL
jgi:hypothetical protein